MLGTFLFSYETFDAVKLVLYIEYKSQKSLLLKNWITLVTH